MRQRSILRRIGIAGALALSVTGLSAVADGAQAMPVALAPVQAGNAGMLAAVQYRYERHHRYHQYYRGHRRAGQYDCGPGGLKTHLQRRVCR